MKKCIVKDCENKHHSKGYCRHHYYINMKNNINKGFKKNVKYEDSLEFYAIKNNKEYLLNEFSHKNEVKAKNVSKGSDKIIWWN